MNKRMQPQHRGSSFSSADGAPEGTGSKQACCCPICSLPSLTPLECAHPGYVQDTSYDIHRCPDCDVHYVCVPEPERAIYDSIYSATSCPGYDRYGGYLERVLREPDALAYLASMESGYFAVREYLTGKTGFRILDVGCGYGYLTYALRRSGFDAFGIDTSGAALEVAQKRFGPYFFHTDIRDFHQSGPMRFDLIAGIEWIEHVADTIASIEALFPLLSERGAILLTTPNKDYYRSTSVWQTDLPPVHQVWLSRKSLVRAAERLNCRCVFLPLMRFSPAGENKLAKYFGTRWERRSKALMTRDGHPASPPAGFSALLQKYANRLLHGVAPVRSLGNLAHNRLIRKDDTLAVILRKRDDGTRQAAG